MAPLHQARLPTIALLSGFLYALLSLFLPAGLPLVRFPAFRFPVAGGATAVPLFQANGTDADIADYTNFSGISPDDVDLLHQGVPCSVEHRLHEARAWITAHPATTSADSGLVPVAIGLRILSLDAYGRLSVQDRVDATGLAQPIQ